MTEQKLKYGEVYELVGFEGRKGVYIGTIFSEEGPKRTVVQMVNEGKIFAYYFKDFYFFKLKGARYLIINDVYSTKEVIGLEAKFMKEMMEMKSLR